MFITVSIYDSDQFNIELFVSQGHLDFPFLGIKQHFWAIKSAVVW